MPYLNGLQFLDCFISIELMKCTKTAENVIRIFIYFLLLNKLLCTVIHKRISSRIYFKKIEKSWKNLKKSKKFPIIKKPRYYGALLWLQNAIYLNRKYVLMSKNYVVNKNVSLSKSSIKLTRSSLFTKLILLGAVYSCPHRK